MRFQLIIFLLFFSSIFYGQTAINNVKLDTSGLFHWNFSIKGKDNVIVSIEKKVGDKWITVYQWNPIRVTNTLFPGDGSSQELPLDPETMNYTDSTIVPIDKGTTTYRMELTRITPPLVPGKQKLDILQVLTSSLATTNTGASHYRKLTAKGDYISLEDYFDFCHFFDNEGKLVKTSGRTNMINITDLKKGLYYVNLPYRQIYLFEKK